MAFSRERWDLSTRRLWYIFAFIGSRILPQRPKKGDETRRNIEHRPTKPSTTVICTSRFPPLAPTITPTASGGDSPTTHVSRPASILRIVEGLASNALPSVPNLLHRIPMLRHPNTQNGIRYCSIHTVTVHRQTWTVRRQLGGDIPALIHPRGTRPLHHLFGHRQSQVPSRLARVPLRLMCTASRDRSLALWDQPPKCACILCLPRIACLQNFLNPSR